MSIQINYEGGVYEIKGLLNSQNGVSLQHHLKSLLGHSKGIVLSLNKVLDIDPSSVNMIASLQKQAQKADKMFYIVGMKNNKVNSLFTALNLNEILL